MSEPTVHELFDLRGRTALITGGSGYLGQSLARALAEAGANVVVTSRDEIRAQTVVDELPTMEGAVHRAVVLDHMNESSIHSGFDAAVEEVGQVDILINNGQ